MEIIPKLIPTLVLTVPFLVTMVALYVIFFGPLLNYLEGRRAETEGARHEAKAMEAETIQTIEQLESRIAQARSEAAKARNEARKQGLSEEQEILVKARAAADERIGQAVGEINEAATAASNTLKDTAKMLADDIAAQVLGHAAAGENA
jgi:F-type H+-transporting ATPase subunit b